MARQFVKALTALAAGALLILGFAPDALAAAGPAAEVGHPVVTAAAQARGYCDPGDTSSVTVVVDFSGVGGGIDIRCSSGSTGQQALGNAFGYSEVASQPGFVCQIEGAPASDCQHTSPGSAYWSYWQAAPGGGWTYSTRGFGATRVKPGGFEGWAFGSGGAPGIDPVLPAAPEPEPPAPEPEQPAPEAGAPPAPEPEQPAAEPVPTAGTPDIQTANDEPVPEANPAAGAIDSVGAAAQAAAEAAAAADAALQAAAATAAQAAAASAAAATSASAATSDSAGGTAKSSSATTSAGDSTALSTTESTSGSTIWFSVVALLAVASLGTAAVVTARRRRAGAGDDQAG